MIGRYAVMRLRRGRRRSAVARDGDGAVDRLRYEHSSPTVVSVMAVVRVLVMVLVVVREMAVVQRSGVRLVSRLVSVRVLDVVAG